MRQFKYEQRMRSGKRRRTFSPVDTNLTSIKNMLLALEMVDRVDQSFVKVPFHKMTTKCFNWLIDKIVHKEAEMVATRKKFLRDNKRRDSDDKVLITEEINDQQKKKRLKTK